MSKVMSESLVRLVERELEHRLSTFDFKTLRPLHWKYSSVDNGVSTLPFNKELRTLLPTRNGRKSFDFRPINLQCSELLEECFKFSIRLFERDFFLQPWEVAVPGGKRNVGPALVEAVEESVFHI